MVFACSPSRGPSRGIQDESRRDLGAASASVGITGCRRADGSRAEVLGELGEDGGGGAGAGAADPFDVGVGSFPFWPVEHGGDTGRGQEGRVGPVRHRGHGAGPAAASSVCTMGAVVGVSIGGRCRTVRVVTLRRGSAGRHRSSRSAMSASTRSRVSPGRVRRSTVNCSGRGWWTLRCRRLSGMRAGCRGRGRGVAGRGAVGRGGRRRQGGGRRRGWRRRRGGAVSRGRRRR